MIHPLVHWNPLQLANKKIWENIEKLSIMITVTMVFRCAYSLLVLQLSLESCEIIKRVTHSSGCNLEWVLVMIDNLWHEGTLPNDGALPFFVVPFVGIMYVGGTCDSFKVGEHIFSWEWVIMLRKKNKALDKPPGHIFHNGASWWAILLSAHGMQRFVRLSRW